MPVKMVALRRHYVSEAGRDFEAGESYVVHDKRIAEKLERRLKAKSQPDTPADRRFPPAAAPVPAPAAPAPAPAAPKVRARALTAETETPAPTTPVPTTPVPTTPAPTTPVPSPPPVPPAASGPAPATLVELPAPDVGKPVLTTAAVPDTGETAESKARYARRDLRAEEA